MAIVTTDNQHYMNIANAIREKTETEDTFKPEEMPEGINEVYNSGYTKAQTAFGVKETVSGVNHVTLEHVNSELHAVNTVVSSKNLFDVSKAETSPISEPQYYGYVVSDGIITANRSLHAIAIGLLSNIVPVANTYTISADVYIPDTNANLGLGLSMGFSDAFTNGVEKYVIGWTSISAYNTWERCSVTVTLTEDDISNGIKYLLLLPVGQAGAVTTLNVQFKNVQVECDTTATPYTPHIADLTGVNITACGDNLFNIASMVGTHSWFSPVYTDNSMSFTCTDSGSYQTVYTKHKFYNTGKTFTISGTSGWRLAIVPRDSDGNYMENTAWITTSGDLTAASGQYHALYHGFYIDPAKNEDGYYSIQVTLPKNIAYWELDFILGTAGTTYTFANIQVELGSEYTGYKPYNGTTYTPKADGTLEAESIAPTMNLISDTSGVVIESEYYQDGAAVINELTDAIINLGGT